VGRKPRVITSSGWLYRNGSPLAACNHQEPWIRMILAFIGVTIVYCWSLYQEGERRGMERGMNLYLPDGKLKIGDKVFEGTATGINIDSDATNDNFGDLPCHPSNSIGHANGYAAHSSEDFLAFRNNTHIPVFIRFVASGTQIYAAIYRSGHSKLIEKQIASSSTSSVRSMKTSAMRR
jgi:hypothetical protein